MRNRKPPANLACSGLFALALLPVLLQTSATQCLAADTSVDALWNDPAAQTAAAPAVTSAPLCNLDSFKQSALIRVGAWPGVGPFRPDGGTQFADASQNKVYLQVDKDKVTSAELTVTDRPRQLIKMQIAADFLLESLGASPSRISEFNNQFARARGEVPASSSKSPLAFGVDRYQVYIYPDSAQRETVNYIIKVNARNGAAPAPAIATTPVTPPPSTIVTTPVTPVTPPSTTTTPPVVATTPDTTPVAPTRVPVTTTPPVSTTPPVVSTTPPAVSTNPSTVPTTPSTAVSGDLKGEFGDLLNRWQKIKKSAVHDRDSSNLFQVLGGKALDKQTDAIQFLISKQRHYDMQAKNVNIDRYSELAPGQKYSVIANITEVSKYIDDAASPPVVLTDKTNTYNVNYTIEKVDGHWLITDSAMVTPQLLANPQSNGH